MIGIKEDGSEVVLHPRTSPIPAQDSDFNKFAGAGLPKGYVAVEYQKSDGPSRTIRVGTLVTLKEAEERAEQNKKDAAAWHKKQADARAAAEKKENAERQARIDAANAAKEKAKAELVAASQPATTKTK